MSNVVHLPAPRTPRLVSKKQLAAELGYSTRWVELRMREGMPVAPRDRRGHARFDVDAVRGWLVERAERPVTMEQRLAQLEAQVARLTAAVERKAG